MANLAMDNNVNWTQCAFNEVGTNIIMQHLVEQNDSFIHARFDGGYRKETNRAGAGVRIQICKGNTVATIAFDIVTIAQNITPVDSYQSELEVAMIAVEHLKHIAIIIMDLSFSRLS